MSDEMKPNPAHDVLTPGSALGAASQPMAASVGGRRDVVAAIALEDPTKLRRVNLLDEADG